MTVFVYFLILISLDFYNFILKFFLTEKAYQATETLFDHISSLLEVCHKYSGVHHIFNPLLSVWKWDQKCALMFDL